MNNRHSLAVAAAGLICVAILAGMLVKHSWPLLTGTRVLLKVQPVDPRDLMRGDYVILSYPFNRVSVSDKPAEPGQERFSSDLPARSEAFKNNNHLQMGTAVWLQLKPAAAPDEAGLTPHSAHSISDKPEPGELNLLMHVASCYWSNNRMSLSLYSSIDALFVQEHTGKPLEEAIRSGKTVYAEVYVIPSGQARVADLIIEGKPVLNSSRQ